MAKDSCIYADPVSKIIAKVGQSTFEPIDAFKKEFIGTRLPYDRLITHSFKISSTISDEDIDIQVELQMYEDMGLDTNKQYKIGYVKKKLDYEESYIIEAFAFEIEKAKEDFEFVLKKHKYIDFVAIPQLIFETLYTNSILNAKKDIFVYLDIDESFFSVYKDGNYLASSSLNSIKDMVKTIDSQDINGEKLLEILHEKGVDSSLYAQEEMYVFEVVNKAFLDIFSKINNIAMHNRSIFGFDSIERVFFTTSKGEVKGLKEFVANFSGNSIELWDFNFGGKKVDDFFIERVAALYIYDKFIQGSDEDNFRFIQKVPPFYKTTVGQYTLFVITIALLSLLYPLYLYLNINRLTKEYNTLNLQYQKLTREADAIRSKVSKIKKKINSVEQQKKATGKKLSTILNSIKELVDMKSSKESYSANIIKINNILKKYHLSLKSLQQSGNDQITLEIIASNKQRDRIAKFMRDIKDGGFKDISTREIKLDSDYYISKIEIIK